MVQRSKGCETFGAKSCGIGRSINGVGGALIHHLIYCLVLEGCICTSEAKN